MKYKGLLYKDLMNLRSSIVVLAVLLIIFCILFVPAGSFYPLFVALATFAPLLVLSTMAMDNEAKWNSFVLTTCVSRKDLVRSKYLLMILLSIFGWVLGIVLYVTLMSAAFDYEFDTGFLKYQTMFLIVISAVIGILHGSIMIPLRFKSNSNAIHYISVGVIILLAAVMVFPWHFIVNLINYLGNASLPIGIGFVFGILAISFACLGISYRISQRIVAKKEF